MSRPKYFFLVKTKMVQWDIRFLFHSFLHFVFKFNLSLTLLPASFSLPNFLHSDLPIPSLFVSPFLPVYLALYRNFSLPPFFYLLLHILLHILPIGDLVRPSLHPAFLFLICTSSTYPSFTSAALHFPEEHISAGSLSPSAVTSPLPPHSPQALTQTSSHSSRRLTKPSTCLFAATATTSIFFFYRHRRGPLTFLPWPWS